MIDRHFLVAPAHVLRPPRALLPALAGLAVVWWRRAQARRELSVIDLRQMRDVGLDPEHVRRECAKPFWKA